MNDLLVQLAGLLALAGGVAWGYWRWIQPREATLAGRGLLLLILATSMGGAIGGVGWWIDDPRSFSWDLPPVASRMLASAAWAFVVVTVMALQRPVFPRLRLALLTLVTYLLPLLVAALLLHLDRFDPAAPITYAFFLIVLGLILPAIWYLFRQPPIIPDQPYDPAPPSRLTRGWLTIVAVVTAPWGLALFSTANGPSDLIWAWRDDLLTSRLIAVMLLTIAVGAVYSMRDADLSRIMVGVITVYGAGVVVANLLSALANKPVNPSYVAVFGIMSVVSVALLVAESHARRTRAKHPHHTRGQNDERIRPPRKGGSHGSHRTFLAGTVFR